MFRTRRDLSNFRAAAAIRTLNKSKVRHTAFALCVSTAFVANDTPFALCVSTAFVAKDTAFALCVPLPSRLKTLPLPCVFHCLRG